jgi:hypothetical protein
MTRRINFGPGSMVGRCKVSREIKHSSTRSFGDEFGSLPVSGYDGEAAHGRRETTQ